MTKYYEGYWQGNAIAHYGIKGQRWGERRFQNEDGSYTAAGKERYKRGEALKKELNEAISKEYAKRIESDKAYKDTEREIKRLDKKYNDYNRDQYSDDEWRNASQRKFNKMEDLESIDSRIHREAKEKATKDFVKKHGETALGDIEYYDNRLARKFLIGFVGASAAIVLAWKAAEMHADKKRSANREFKKPRSYYSI